MKTLPLAVAAFCLMGGMALAQDGVPGAHFVENWDLDGDGKVTLAEVTERRGDIFTSFDTDEDGILSPAEYDQFDQARANDQASNGAGGQGQGKGHGKGHGKGGYGGGDKGMERGFHAADANGGISRDAFVGKSEAWIAMMDRDGDGVVTLADFARG